MDTLSETMVQRRSDRTATAPQAETTKGPGGAFDDLPLRWRTLFARTDESLAQDLVQEPAREERPIPAAANGVRPLREQMILLERTHAGLPMVALCHAALIVLIRRENHLEPAKQHYFALWDRHEELLLKSLSLRWLVSAADTFADHGRDPAERVAGLSVALFVNTIKLYETERARSGPPRDPHFARSNAVAIDLDGVLGFRVARGDTVGNMYKRKDRVLAELAQTPHGLPGRLLDEALSRVNRLDTVYARFRRLHQSKTHAW